MAVAIPLVGILSALALVHFWWATRRTASLAAAVPSEGGKPLFSPGPLACVIVGALLSLAALVCAVRAGWLLADLSPALSRAGVWGSFYSPLCLLIALLAARLALSGD